MGGGGDIILLDIELESFQRMRGSPQSCHDGKLFDKEGTLALLGSFTPRPNSINIWVMQDYEAKEWAFKYRIGLSMVEASKTTLFSFLQKEKE